MADADKQIVPSEGVAGEEAPQKKSKLKLIIIGVAAVLVLGGGGFFGWKLFFGPKPSPAPANAPASAPAANGDSHGAAPAVDKDGNPLPVLAPAPQLVMTLDPFMVNLADTNARRFLRVIVVLDVGDATMKTALEERMPRIRDSLILLFSSKTSADLSSAQGKYRLRMEILKTVNNVLGLADKITQAYYMEFVVQ